MDAADILDQLVEGHRWQNIAPMLAAMDEDELAGLRPWYRRTGRRRARRAAEGTLAPGRAGQLMLAVALPDTPEEASACCEWGRSFVWHDDHHVLPAVVPLLARRGRDWCEGFVTAAAEAQITGRPVRAAAELTALSLPLVDHFGLEVPDGEQYARGWAQLAAWVRGWSRRPDRRYPWESMRPIVISHDGRATYTFTDPHDVTLDRFFGATPRLQDTLVAVMRAPNAMAELTDLKDGPWSLEESVRTAVRSGLLNRATLFEAALEALTRTDTPVTQRITSRLLLGLDLTPDDLLLQLPLIGHVLPTVHGSATAVLLPPLLAAKLSADDLQDIGATILSRKEKAQKTALLRHLTSAATRSGPAADAAVPLLTMAAKSEDTAFAGRAAKALAGLGAEAERPADTVDDLPWDATGSVAPTEPFRPAEPTRAGLAALYSDTQTHARIANDARWLDTVVRFAAHDSHGLRDAILGLPAGPTWFSRTLTLLRQWAETGKTRRSTQGSMTEMKLVDGQWVPGTQRTFELRREPYEAFMDELVTETMERLGTVDQLLSTPSREDGTLALTDLASRIEATAAAGYGPFDLVQALLRLEPATPSDLHLLDGLHIAPLTRPGLAGSIGRLMRHRARAADGVAVVRAWVEAGGLPQRLTSMDRGALMCRAATVPRVLPEVDIIAPQATSVGATTRRLGWGIHPPAEFLGVVPSWVEVLVSLVEQQGGPDSTQHTARLRTLEHSAGPIGPAVHVHVARLLAHPRQDCRAEAVRSVLCLMRQGRLDEDLLRTAAVTLLAEGRLPLARTAWSWEQVILGGGLRRLWPAVHAVLDSACAAQRKPTGLADMLRTLRPYIGVVAANTGGDVLPASVHRLAVAKGSSKAHVEARALVTALEAR